MKNILFTTALLLAMGNLYSQQLAGEYFLPGQGGEIVLRLQAAGNNQLTGTMTDIEGTVYQVQASVEDGDAFGTLINQQGGGMYFEAYLDEEGLQISLIPAGPDGQPNASGGQDFVMNVRSGGNPGFAPQSPPTPPQNGQVGGVFGNLGQTNGNTGNTSTSWSGTFSGNAGGTATTVQLTSNGGQLQGQVDAAGYKYQMQGQVSGQQSQGQFIDVQTQGAMSYSAQLNGDQLTVTVTNPMNGQSSQFQFSRAGASAPKTGGGLFNRGGFGSSTQTQPNNNTASAGGGDQRIVGNWLYTDSYSSGQFGFTSQLRLIINQDGSFIYGDAKVAGGGPGIGGSSGGGDVTRGQWKAENGILYVNGGSGFQPYCRYESNGQSLLMYFNDGSKQLWKRSY